MTSPTVEEWYVPVRLLFHSEAEGGSHKTHTEGGGGGGGEGLGSGGRGGAELFGAPHFIVQREVRNVGLDLKAPPPPLLCRLFNN